MSRYVGLYLTQTLYPGYEKAWQFKSPKNYTIRTGYFWEVENKLKVLLAKVFRKCLWNFGVFCLLAPNLRMLGDRLLLWICITFGEDLFMICPQCRQLNPSGRFYCICCKHRLSDTRKGSLDYSANTLQSSGILPSMPSSLSIINTTEKPLSVKMKWNYLR